MKTAFLFPVFAATGLLAADKDKVFSGPQPGEKATSFEVRELTARGPGAKRDPLKEAGDRPVALVFLHGVERSMVPLMRVVDRYGAEQKTKMVTEFVFLASDPIVAERNLPRTIGALRMNERASYSLDGIEGPGNYGLNKKCLITIVLTKGGRVAANFALVQPGIADGPAVVAAMAKLAGDKNPPAAEALLARPGQGRPMRRPLDLAKLDIETDAGRRASIEKLIAEVRYLRQQLSNRPNMRPRPNARPNNQPKKPLPGAVPTDARLVGMLRQFIQKTNTDADVDRVLANMKKHAGDNAGLLQQACDGLTRVISVNYGTPYAQQAGREFIRKHSRK